jgi:hypothetical protein
MEMEINHSYLDVREWVCAITIATSTDFFGTGEVYQFQTYPEEARAELTTPLRLHCYIDVCVGGLVGLAKSRRDRLAPLARKGHSRHFDTRWVDLRTRLNANWRRENAR